MFGLDLLVKWPRRWSHLLSSFLCLVGTACIQGVAERNQACELRKRVTHLSERAKDTLGFWAEKDMKRSRTPK